MRIVGLLSWFDERPEDLARAISSHAAAGMLDALVALDGRYALYGGSSAECVSGAEQYDAIYESCALYGLDVTVGYRRTPWPGEVSKRTALFRHGAAVAECMRDWFWIIDADNELVEHPEADEVRARLASTPHHASEVILSEPGKLWQDVRRPMRQLYRALPYLAAYGRHWHYVAQVEGEWAYLWGPGERVVPALEMHDVVIRHHHMEREQERRNRSYSYYAERDSRGVETSPPWIVTGPDGYPDPANGEDELA